MHKGQGIETVSATILAQKAMKRDYIASTDRLQMTDKAELQFTTGVTTRVYQPSEICIRQIGDRVGIPAKYLERMRAQAPELLARNVNHWFTAQPEKRMIRTFENGTNTARAFLSNSFRPLDNIDIASHVLPRLVDAGCEIASTAITDSRLYIQAIIPRMEATIAKVGDVVNSGVVISNSEVGCGSLWIEHLVWTKKCTNGMIGQNVIRKNHVGRRKFDDVEEAREFFSDNTRQADDKAFWLKVQDLVKHALSKEMFDSAIAKLNEAVKVEIESPSEVIEVMSERFAWQDQEAEKVLNHFIRGGSATQYGLLNAVTRTAEDIESYDRAIEFERAGGEILLLKPSDFNNN